MHQDFRIAVGAGYRRLDQPEALQSYFSGRGRHRGDDAGVHNRIGHEPALADVLAAGLELRLHERDDLGRPADQRRQHRKNVAQGDERDVDADARDRRAGILQIAGLEVPRVGVFDHRHARVAAHLPVQLAVAHVERDHMTRAALQPHVGEAAGRRAHVEGDAIGGVDPEGVERRRELDAAAADPRMIGADHAHVRIDRHHGAGLGGAVAVGIDLSRENQRARLLTRLDQSFFHEERIEPLLTFCAQ